MHLAEMEELYDILRRRVQELELARRQNQEMFLATMETLARTLGAKDKYTRGHSGRVAEYAVKLAVAVGMEAEERKERNLAGEATLAGPSSASARRFALLSSYGLQSSPSAAPARRTLCLWRLPVLPRGRAYGAR